MIQWERAYALGLWIPKRLKKFPSMHCRTFIGSAQTFSCHCSYHAMYKWLYSGLIFQFSMTDPFLQNHMHCIYACAYNGYFNLLLLRDLTICWQLPEQARTTQSFPILLEHLQGWIENTVIMEQLLRQNRGVTHQINKNTESLLHSLKNISKMCPVDYTISHVQTILKNMQSTYESVVNQFVSCSLYLQDPHSHV